MSDPEIVRLKNAVTDRDHVAGPLSAPVTLVEYGNFECIHCGRAYPAIKEVRKLLGNNLRFVFRHFPTVRTHPHSLRAAEAAEAAGAQEKFWQMHDELFTHQQALEDHDLSRYARRIGLDAERFARDMAENTFLKMVEADYNRSLFDEHVTGTPTFYINDVRYTGAADVESLLLAIKQADTDGRIRLPERAGGIRGMLGRLRRRVNG
jgi:protein-disulfide isomerase